MAQTKELTFGIPKSLRETIGESTPREYIKTRVGRGNTSIKYVEGSYVQRKLNELFNCMWDFKVLEKQIGTKHIWVLGQLTVHFKSGDEIATIVKEQFGGSQIKIDRSGQVIDIADDLKAASTDSLKKCASLLGIAQDVYGGEGYDTEEPVVAPVESPKITEKQITYIYTLCTKKGISKTSLKDSLKVSSLADITMDRAEKVIAYLESKPDIQNVEPDDIPF